MKKVLLQRIINIPEFNYCITWKNMDEICPALIIRKNAKEQKILFGCDFYNVDLAPNINSIGIKKFCEKIEQGEVVQIHNEE